MKDKERAAGLAKAAPPLNEREEDAINALFPAYAFRRSRTGELWMTCCRRHTVLTECGGKTPEEQAVMQELHQKEVRNRWENGPEPVVRCPYCGTPVIVKELGRTGRRENLSRYRRAVVLRWHQGCLWARAYDCGKHYTEGHVLNGSPDCKLIGVYRFRPGLAEETSRSWYGNEPFSYYSAQDAPLTKGKWNIHSPFTCNAEYGVGYDVIGMEEVSKSPFRYCMAGDYERHGYYFLEFLTACCFYSRQIEMLMKAGMRAVVRDLAGRGVKNAGAINWSETDPFKAFGLDRREMKAFLATDRNIDIILLYKRLKRRVSMQEAADWVQRGANIRETIHQAKSWNLPPEKLFRYLAREAAGHMGNTLQGWKDYIHAAQALGYPLHRENVLLPKKLSEAHDAAAEKHRRKLQQEWDRSETEKRRLREMSYAERKAILELKYGYAAEGYVILVPGGEQEIIDEGKILKHCVAGYAARHMEGKTTILFMRKAKCPDQPFLTIEMDGNRLKQIHGYRNEGLYSAKGRFAPDPRKVHRGFLDPWLDWVKKGSKRDKQGQPVLPGKKKEVKIA